MSVFRVWIGRQDGGCDRISVVGGTKENIMRKIICGLAGAAALAAAQFIAAGTLLAQEPYRWCAVYGGGRNGIGATNCGFVTLEQCRETILGMGGFCNENPAYQGSARPRKRHHH
jgi:hypothetical protein